MKQNDLIESAKSFLGKPYVWGGESDEEGGYDCSGFLYAALRKAGFQTSRKTAQGFSTIGTSVSFSDIKAGDLLFFGKSASAINHCAIYFGNDTMIESIGSKSNKKANKGKGVTISSIYRRLDCVVCRRVCEDIKNTSRYSVGKNYTVVCNNLNIRYSPNGERKDFNHISADAQKHANKKGQLQYGTKVTCKELSLDGENNLWMRIPSGWICAIYHNNVYVA